MPSLLKIAIGSTALIALSVAQGQIVPSTRTCTKNSGGDRCDQCNPHLVVAPEAPTVKVGQSVALSITVPGMSKAADCALSGDGSVQWTPLAGQALPKVYIQEGEPCGAGGTRLDPGPSGPFALASPTYKKAGDYYVPIHVESTFKYKAATYTCEADRTIKVTVLP
jgi:hypothetical protein